MTATDIWRMSWRADPIGRDIADRHYNRQKIGAAQFVPPGRCVVLLSGPTPPRRATALWVTSWPIGAYVQHEWPGAWVNSLFRREGGDWVASEMIRHAVAVTRWRWPDVPELGMITFIDPTKVRRKRDVGRCYRRAGFQHVGETKGGLLAFQMTPDRMPPALEPAARSGQLFAWA